MNISSNSSKKQKKTQLDHDKKAEDTSSSGLPRQSIIDAINFCGSLREKGIERVNSEEAASVLGYTGRTDGKFVELLQSAHLYGLLKTRKLEISQLGEQCVYPKNASQKDKAVSEAVMRIGYYRERIVNRSTNPFSLKTLPLQIKYKFFQTKKNSAKATRCARVMINNLNEIGYGEGLPLETKIINLDNEGRRYARLTIPDMILAEEKEKIIDFLKNL